MRARTKGPKAEKKKSVEILIYDAIGYYGISAEKFVNDLRAKGDIDEINLKINSPGGSVFEGNAIFNELLSHKATVNVTIDGYAASMASIIAMAGDHIAINDNAFFMIHNPLVLTIGDSEALRKEADLLDKMKENAIKAYRKHAKDTSAEEFRALMDDETWIDADMALDMGFADEIIETVDSEDAEDVKAKGQEAFAQMKKEFQDQQEKGQNYNSDESEVLAIRDSQGKVVLSISNKKTQANQSSTNSSKGGAKMRFDEHGNLVDEQGKIVYTKAQLDAAKVAADTTPNDAATQAHAKEIEDAKNEAKENEKARVLEIKSLCASLKLGNEFEEKMINENTAIDEVRKLAIDQHTKDLESASTAEVQGDEADKRREGMIKAILVNSGTIRRSSDNKEDVETFQEVRANEFSNLGLQMLVKHCAYQAGYEKAYQCGAAETGQLFKHLLYGTGPFMAMSTNTNDLLSVVDTSANKVLLKAWDTVPTTYQLLTSTARFSDLKQHSMYKNSEAPDVLEIPEGQAPKMASLSDAKETGTLKKVGRAWSITEEAIINDSLDVFTMWPEKFGRSIPREINYDFWYAICSGNGPTLNETSRALFNATDGNLVATGAGAAPSAATLQAGFTAFRGFKILQPDGGRSRDQYARVAPRFLAVGQENEWNAKQQTRNTVLPGGTNAEVNFFGPNQETALFTIVEPLIASVNENAWFLVARPEDIDGCKVATLTGRETPAVASKIGGAGEVKGIIQDIEHFYKVVFVDWRAFYKNEGE